MHEHILWEARPHIPFTPEEVNIDYDIIESPDVHPDKVAVILAAAKKEKLNDYLNVVNMAGKNATMVDLESFALLNAVTVNYEMYKDRTIAIINIGSSITNVVIARGGYPIFVRDIAFGGNQFTDRLTGKKLLADLFTFEIILKNNFIAGHKVIFVV